MIKLKIRTTARILFGNIILLLFANILTQLTQGYSNELIYESFYLLQKAFDFNTEHNIPTFYNTLLFLINCILLLLISKIDIIQNRWYWFSMSIIFCFLSLDEMLMIHDRLNAPLRDLFNASGIFYWTWIIPYSLALMVLGFLYFRFFRKLPKKITYYFVLSAVVFLTGAIGIETLEGLHFEKYGQFTKTYFMLYTIEETMEMLGLSIFCLALMKYLLTISKTFEIQIE